MDFWEADVEWQRISWSPARGQQPFLVGISEVPGVVYVHVSSRAMGVRKDGGGMGWMDTLGTNPTR